MKSGGLIICSSSGIGSNDFYDKPLVLLTGSFDSRCIATRRYSLLQRLFNDADFSRHSGVRRLRS